MFSAFGLGYRYAMWLRQTADARSTGAAAGDLSAHRRTAAGNLAHLAALFWNNVVRSGSSSGARTRAGRHTGFFWGCMLAAAVTFPLSFGWIRFETARGQPGDLQAFVFGFHVFTFHLGSPLAPLVFNVLDISAVLVLIGVFAGDVAPGPRSRRAGVQQFAADLLPLVMLFAVSHHRPVPDGLDALDARAALRVPLAAPRGHGDLHAALSAVRQVLPHLPAAGAARRRVLRETGAKGAAARCVRCGEPFASRMHIDDLKQVERAHLSHSDIRWQTATHYQDVCPPCRRKNLALTQDALWKARRSRWP